jgi:hypothetical protein
MEAKQGHGQEFVKYITTIVEPTRKGEGNTTLNGPYSVIVSSLESYIPKQKSFEELQHAQMGTQ